MNFPHYLKFLHQLNFPHQSNFSPSIHYMIGVVTTGAVGGQGIHRQRRSQAVVKATLSQVLILIEEEEANSASVKNQFLGLV